MKIIDKLKILIKNFITLKDVADQKKIGVALVKYGDNEILDILTAIDSEKLSRETSYLLNIIINKLSTRLGVQLRVDKGQKIELMKKLAESNDLSIIKECLSSPEYQKRLMITEVVEEIGMKELIPFFASHLEHEQHPFILSKLVKVIPTVGGEAYVSLIEPYLKSENDRIVSNAIEGLTTIDSYDFSDRIGQFVSHESERVRSSILLWMNKQDYEKSFSVAKSMIQSKTERVRMAAVYTLSKLGTKEAVSVVAEHVLFNKNESDELREKSRELFELSDDEYVRDILKKYYNFVLAEKDFDEFDPPPETKDEIDIDQLLKLTTDSGIKIDLKSELQKIEGIVHIDNAAGNIGILKIQPKSDEEKKRIKAQKEKHLEKKNQQKAEQQKAEQQKAEQQKIEQQKIEPPKKEQPKKEQPKKEQPKNEQPKKESPVKEPVQVQPPKQVNQKALHDKIDHDAEEELLKSRLKDEEPDFFLDHEDAREEEEDVAAGAEHEIQSDFSLDDELNSDEPAPEQVKPAEKSVIRKAPEVKGKVRDRDEMVHKLASEDVEVGLNLEEQALDDDAVEAGKSHSDPDFPVKQFSEVIQRGNDTPAEGETVDPAAHTIEDMENLEILPVKEIKSRKKIAAGKKEINFIPIILGVMVVLFGIAFYILYPRYVNDKTYKTAEGHFKKAEYEQAYSIFSKIRGYQNSGYYADACYFYINVKKASKMILTDDFNSGIKIIRELFEKYNDKEFRFSLSTNMQDLLKDFTESEDFNLANFDVLYKLSQEIGVPEDILKKAGIGKIFRLIKNKIVSWDTDYLKQEFLDRMDYFLGLDKMKTQQHLVQLLNEALGRQEFIYARKVMNLVINTGYPRNNLVREFLLLYSYEITKALKNKEIEKAAELFMKLKKINPQEIIESYSFPNDHLVTAELYSSLGNSKKALQIYEVLLKKGTISEDKKKELLEHWQVKADTLMKQKDYFGAYPLYRNLFENGLNSTDMKLKIEKNVELMIEFYKKENDLDGMKNAYAEMLKLFGEQDKFRYQMYKEILFLEGEFLLHDRMLPEAIALFKDLVVKYPDFKAGKEKFIECQMVNAEDLYLRGEYSESVTMLEDFYKKFPAEFKKLGIFVSLANAMSKLAKEKFYRGEVFEAKKQLLKALEYHSESDLAKELLEKVNIAIAEDYVKENRFDVAIEMLQKSMAEVGGKSDAIKRRMAQVLERKSEYLEIEQLKNKKAEERQERLAALEKEKMLKRRADEIAEEKMKNEKMNKYFFVFEDPFFDDRGPGYYKYPDNKLFTTGSFDIRRFEIVNNSETVSFNISIGNQILKDISSSGNRGSSSGDRGTTSEFRVGSNGWVMQMFDIYIRYGEKGKHAEGLPGRSIILENGWDKVIVVCPTGSSELHRDLRLREDVLIPSYFSVKNNVFSFNIAKSDFGEQPTHKWSYQLVSMNFNPEYLENYFYVNPVQSASSDMGFGGGTNYDGDPNVIDILDTDTHPQFVSLSKYKSFPSVKDNKYAIIHMYTFDEITNMFFKSKE